VISPIAELRSFGRAALIDPLEHEHQESTEALVQRRWISSVGLAVGSFMLAFTLRLAPGDPAFYAATFALSVVWIVAGLVAGSIHLGRSRRRRGNGFGRGILQGVILGIALLSIFLAGSALVAPIPALRDPLVAMLLHGDKGLAPLVAVLTGLIAIGEELFFRGALWAAVGGRQALLVTTLVYALTTIPSGFPLMVLAAAVVGFVAGAHRRVTGGVLGPIIIHLIWSLGLFLLLPVILGGS